MWLGIKNVIRTNHMISFYFYQIMTYFNSLKIMSLNCDAKKEEEKGGKSTIRKWVWKYVQSREWIKGWDVVMTVLNDSTESLSTAVWGRLNHKFNNGPQMFKSSLAVMYCNDFLPKLSTEHVWWTYRQN